MSAHRVEGGTLELGGGLDVLLSGVLRGAVPGEIVEVVTDSRNTALELPAWARLMGHEVTAEAAERAGGGSRFVVGIRRGRVSPFLASEAGAQVGAEARLRPDGEFHSTDLRGGFDAPAHADPATGFIPLGAVPEQGSPRYHWPLSEREAMWADDVAELAEQSSAAQWDASRDIPWDAVGELPDFLEDAVAQVMTFIAQNEYAALYVPAEFLPQVNPAYAEMLLWLASHVHDEARHIEVFTKRALIGGRSGRALAATELSLKTLLEERDFSAAALLLNVLGEGTFLDLLRFVERFAPDAATQAAARMAHRDERRHVHFGISHVRRVIQQDPEHAGALVHAAEQRAAKLAQMSGLHPLVTESLTALAAGSMQPAELSEGAAAVRDLMATMGRNRVRRLRSAGFDEQTARYISDLHTPNLM